MIFKALFRDFFRNFQEEPMRPNTQLFLKKVSNFQGLSSKNLTYRVLNDSIVKDSQGLKKEVECYEI